MEESKKDMEAYSMTGALEAVLFAMGEPVEVLTLAKALDTELVTVLHVIEALKKTYDDMGRGITLLELNGKVQLCTKSQYYKNLIRIAAAPEKPTLSNTLMETLAIVAYKQPVTKAEITKIRGVSSDHAVNRLVEYGLIQEAGRLNAPGRPILFATSEEFLRRFGMNSIEGLPVVSPEGNAPAQEEVDIFGESTLPEGAVSMTEETVPELAEETVPEMVEETVPELSVEVPSQEAEPEAELSEVELSETELSEVELSEAEPLGSEPLGSELPEPVIRFTKFEEIDDVEDLDDAELLAALSLAEDSAADDYLDFLSDGEDDTENWM